MSLLECSRVEKRTKVRKLEPPGTLIQPSYLSPQKKDTAYAMSLNLTALPGFEPGKCWSQSPVPYRLAIALQHVL